MANKYRHNYAGKKHTHRQRWITTLGIKKVKRNRFMFTFISKQHVCALKQAFHINFLNNRQACLLIACEPVCSGAHY